MDGSAYYESQSSFILGFHGCDESVGMKILCNPQEHLSRSEKDYDWLGSGIYFWEGSVSRAWDWANAYHQAGKIKKPFVLGAVIDLKHCLDLFDYGATAQIQKAYSSLEEVMNVVGEPMPENKGRGDDKPARFLDRAVMQTLHGIRKEKKADEYDSVRGAFLEGERVYPGAGFRTHTHIQICVRNENCIKGYFKPIHATER